MLAQLNHSIEVRQSSHLCKLAVNMSMTQHRKCDLLLRDLQRHSTCPCRCHHMHLKVHCLCCSSFPLKNFSQHNFTSEYKLVYNLYNKCNFCSTYSSVLSPIHIFWVHFCLPLPVEFGHHHSIVLVNH